MSSHLKKSQKCEISTTLYLFTLTPGDEKTTYNLPRYRKDTELSQQLTAALKLIKQKAFVYFLQ